jgi:hypothetical protein
MGHCVIIGTPSAQQFSLCFTPCLQSPSKDPKEIFENHFRKYL